jgi:hypothetical protein
VNVLRSHAALTSLIGGILFATLVLAFGGGSGSIVGVVLAVILGAVFAVSMYWAALRARRSPPT